MKIIPENRNLSWNEFLNSSVVIEEISKIESILKNEAFFPETNNILRFLNMNPNNIKCVVVGMEPYPTDYELNGEKTPIATGRSFEVANVTSWSQKFKQSSLRNILKAVYFESTGVSKSLDSIRSEIENGTYKISQPKSWFDGMESQGVLFLNAALTVKQYQVNTHSKIWETFMNELIQFTEAKSQPRWLLFGKDAQKRVLPFIDIDRASCTCHPRLSEFVKERPFKDISDKINIVI
jgi:uracil-DNA glycosylase